MKFGSVRFLTALRAARAPHAWQLLVNHRAGRLAGLRRASQWLPALIGQRPRLQLEPLLGRTLPELVALAAAEDGGEPATARSGPARRQARDDRPAVEERPSLTPRPAPIGRQPPADRRPLPGRLARQAAAPLLGRLAGAAAATAAARLAGRPRSSGVHLGRPGRTPAPAAQSGRPASTADAPTLHRHSERAAARIRIANQPEAAIRSSAPELSPVGPAPAGAAGSRPEQQHLAGPAVTRTLLVALLSEGELAGRAPETGGPAAKRPPTRPAAPAERPDAEAGGAAPAHGQAGQRRQPPARPGQPGRSEPLGGGSRSTVPDAPPAVAAPAELLRRGNGRSLDDERTTVSGATAREAAVSTPGAPRPALPDRASDVTATGTAVWRTAGEVDAPSGEELARLADRLKQILDDEARRHGIDV